MRSFRVWLERKHDEIPERLAYSRRRSIYINPTIEEMKSCMSSDTQGARGILESDGTVYLWDSGALDHGPMAQYLGVNGLSFYIHWNTSKYLVFSISEWSGSKQSAAYFYQQITTNPNIKRMVGPISYSVWDENGHEMQPPRQTIQQVA